MLPAAPPLELAQLLSGTAWMEGTTALHGSGGAGSHKVKGEGDAHWAVDPTLLGHALRARVEPKLPDAVVADVHRLSYVVSVSVDTEKLDSFSGSFDRMQRLIGSVTLTEGHGNKGTAQHRRGFDLSRYWEGKKHWDPKESKEARANRQWRDVTVEALVEVEQEGQGEEAWEQTEEGKERANMMLHVKQDHRLHLVRVEGEDKVLPVMLQPWKYAAPHTPKARTRA